MYRRAAITAQVCGQSGISGTVDENSSKLCANKVREYPKSVQMLSWLVIVRFDCLVVDSDIMVGTVQSRLSRAVLDMEWTVTFD